MEIKPEFEGLMEEETERKFYTLMQDELRWKQARADEAVLRQILIRLDHLIEQIDLIVELLLKRQMGGLE